MFTFKVSQINHKKYAMSTVLRGECDTVLSALE